MSDFSATEHWNWSAFCGHGEHFASWDGKDFGHCFEQVAILAPAHALLCIISVYQFGRRRTSLRGKSLYVSWTWFLILRQVAVVMLALSPVVQVIVSVTVEHTLPSIADGVVIGVALFTWIFHAFYVWNLRYLHSSSLRGPPNAIIAFLIVVASCGIHVHTVIVRHIFHSSHRNATEEYSTYVNAALCLVYLISIVPNKRRIYHTNIVLQVNETEDESEPLTWERIRSYGALNTASETENIVAERGVGYLSWLTFQWVQRLMSRGADMKISSVNDLYLLPKRLNTHQVEIKFEKVIQKLLCSTDSPGHRQGVSNTLSGEVENDAEVPNVNVVINSSKRDYETHGRSSISGTNSESSDSENENENTPLCHHTQQSTTGARPKVSLVKALSSAFGVQYFSLGILKLLADCFGFAGPILLNYLVSFIENKSDPTYQGYLFAGGLFLSTLLGTLCSTQFDYNVQVVAYKLRCALITTIYKKSLTVNGVVQAMFTSGEIVNFMSTDTDRILNFCPSFHAFWSLPFQVGVSLFLLYQQVGLAFLAGLGFAVLLVPINRCIAVKIGTLSTEMMKYKDERVKLMNELLYGIRVVKFYSWENHFTNRINDIRCKELRCLKGRKYLDALCVFFWATTPVLISILTFATYVLLGYKLTAAKVFTSLSLFLMLISPLNAFPWVINGLVEAWVSLKRVQKFICLQDSDLHQYYSSGAGDDEEIHIRGGTFTWTSRDGEAEGSRNTHSSIEEPSSSDGETASQESSGSVAQTPTQDLQDIYLKVDKGQFIGVIGKVGSGKSSLLNAIVGEMNRKQGHISVRDLEEGFALVAQEPWVQHATVRDNILFGQPYNSRRYDVVLEACALIDDLKTMPAGDMTEIGENGITLSGGQRARVALARAVYQDKSVYLLDDPLSAVDAHVAKHIYTHCIMGLLRDKTRVLCTHHVKFLKRADWVMVMEDGRIVQSGPPGEILPNVQLDERQHDQHSKEGNDEENVNEEEQEDHLMQEEERQKGVVKGAVYSAYWRAVGMCLSPLVLITLFFMQASRNSSDWWLSYWVSHTHDKADESKAEDVTSLLVLWLRDVVMPLANLTSAEDNLKFYLGVYGGLAGANSIFTLLRAFLFAYGGVCAAAVVHQRLLFAIIKAPLTFFDTTPIGRIVNRFSSDLYAVDDSLPFTLNIFLAQAYGIFGTLVITCYGLPWFAICLVPMAAVYYKIQHYYRHTSRELKRLSSITLSPIYAHFSETITGLATIRAMRHSQRFFEENRQRLDINQRAQYATQLSARWLDFRLRMLGVAMVTCLSLIAVIQHQLTTVDAGLVGLAISYSLSVTNLLGGVVMFFTETEKEFVSVERCQYYITETPSEKWDGALFPPSLWPTEGVVEFDKVSLQYRDTLTFALDEVCFKTRPGEKIGIVGRTGAGKSSLFLALFRMVEVKRGRILVDDVDIGHLDLADVRSRFAIIPQDPFLFSGSVRMNLDPTSSYSDSDLWSFLDRCHLRTCVERMGGLDAVVAQRGKEFSVGQRQLMCLARAMLTRAKVLCIDEATASVDMETDGLIQTTIRHEFRESTVLTIAHRVNTVMDSHRVLVMRDGAVAEFAPPADLLQNPNSLFYHLVYGNN